MLKIKSGQTAFERSEEFGSDPESRKNIGQASQQRLLRSHLEEMTFDIETVIEYLGMISGSEFAIEGAKKSAMKVKKRIGACAK